MMLNLVPNRKLGLSGEEEMKLGDYGNLVNWTSIKVTPKSKTPIYFNRKNLEYIDGE